MRVKFETIFRGLLVFILLVGLGSIWAVAQTGGNKLQAATTNNPSGLAGDSHWSGGHYLTFGLDRITLLSENEILGEPLWKYIASLVYILLAFYVSKIIDFIARVWL